MGVNFASRLTPDHPANPTPGVNYLRHVGFLGAAAPAVPGLKPVHFAAHEGTVEFALDLDARSFAGAEGGDTVPGLLSRLRALLGKGGGTGAPRPDPRDQAALDAVEVLAALREENAALRAELDALKPSELPEETAEFAAMRSQVETFRRDKLDRDLERLIDQGRLLPVLKAQVLDFAAGLDAAETVSFAAGGETTQRDWFLDFLARQPVTVSFGSCIPTEGPLADDSRAFDHMPAGYSADPTHEPIYRRARQIEAEKGISFAAAVTVAMSEGR